MSGGPAQSLPEAFYERIAGGGLRERCKIHDIVSLRPRFGNSKTGQTGPRDGSAKYGLRLSGSSLAATRFASWNRGRPRRSGNRPFGIAPVALGYALD